MKLLINISLVYSKITLQVENDRVCISEDTQMMRDNKRQTVILWEP